MIRAWEAAALLVLWIASIAASAWWFYGAGRNVELATQAREDQVAQRATDAAASAAAAAISHIEVKNVTVNHALQREVETRTVYSDCRSGMDAVQLLNGTPGIAAARPEPVASGIVPPAGPAR